MTFLRVAVTTFAISASLVSAACEAGTLSEQQDAQPQNAQSKYIGQENRTIKSLSDEDIAEIKRGGGWGLAKAAELNGVPGPSHVLSFRKELELSDDQAATTQAIFDDMKVKAIAAGTRYIDIETKLDQDFRHRAINDEQLQTILHDIGNALSELRYIHLSTHLQMLDILSNEQVAKYITLRGYSYDPCAVGVPEGHDEAMWREHNNCN